MTAKEMKTVCQSGDPAISDGGLGIAERTFGFRISETGLRKEEGLGSVMLILPFRNPVSEIRIASAAKRDRRAPARPSLRRSARRAAGRRDRAGRERPAWFPRREAVTVFCSRAIVEVGLNATRKKMSSPLLIPPCTPPELFVVVRTFSSRTSKGSLCSEPFIRVARKSGTDLETF